jgi:mono/diheme cytochrome c family protein
MPTATISGDTGSPVPAAPHAAAGEDVIQLAQASGLAAERPVSYSVEQAARGETRYMRECYDCHGANLDGGTNGGAPLRGLVFESKFTAGVPASALFQYMATTMPPNAPGRLSPGVYADLMAFILKRNGIEAGMDPLPSDLDELDFMIVEK